MTYHRLTLPSPPSANRYWRRSGNRLYKSAEATAYIQQVAAVAHSAGLEPLECDVTVYVEWYRPAKRGDLDNRLKVLLDALQGVAYIDDRQVAEIHARRHEDKADPRVVVTVASVEPPF